MTLHPDIAAVLAGERRWAVITGDCLEVLPTIPAGSIDLALTDPPYGHNNNNGDLIHRRGVPSPTTGPKPTTCSGRP